MWVMTHGVKGQGHTLGQPYYSYSYILGGHCGPLHFWGSGHSSHPLDTPLGVDMQNRVEIQRQGQVGGHFNVLKSQPIVELPVTEFTDIQDSVGQSETPLMTS